MKKLFINATIILLCIITLCSCSTTAQTFGSMPLSYPWAMAEVEVDYNNKLTSTSSNTYLFGFLRIGGGKYADVQMTGESLLGGFCSKTRASAIYKALNGNNYDVIVAPNFIDQKRVGFLHLWVTYETRLTCFGGRITSINQYDYGQSSPSANEKEQQKTSNSTVTRAEQPSQGQGTIPTFTSPEDAFLSGIINSLPKEEKANLIKRFMTEIRSGFKNAKTENDYIALSSKLNVLKTYNDALSRRDASINDFIIYYKPKVDAQILRLTKKKENNKSKQAKDSLKAVSSISIDASSDSTTTTKQTSNIQLKIDTDYHTIALDSTILDDALMKRISSGEINKLPKVEQKK